METSREQSPKPWYAAGLRFECTACGKCCTARGEYSHVYVNTREAHAMAAELGVTLDEFDRRYAKFDRDGDRELRFVDGRCVFLEGAKCAVYQARPTQCRTWPFWSETLKKKVWKEEVVPFCPGAGKGRLHSRFEMERSAQQADRALREP